MRCAVTDSKSVVERGGTAPSSALAFAGAWVLRIFFFFSSRRRHTRYIGDWSSDVCSSDLFRALTRRAAQAVRPQELGYDFETAFLLAALTRGLQIGRASCRERVEISVVAEAVKKKKLEEVRRQPAGREDALRGDRQQKCRRARWYSSFFRACVRRCLGPSYFFFFFKQKTAYEIHR